MRKLLFCTIALCLSIASCTLERSDNGDLDGFWQLTQVDSLTNGRSADMKESRVFWSVQTDLLQVWAEGYAQVLFRFDHKGDSLLLSSPYEIKRWEGDVAITNADTLRVYGINELEERFRVAQLDGGTMILQSTMLRLYFRHY